MIRRTVRSLLPYALVVAVIGIVAFRANQAHTVTPPPTTAARDMSDIEEDIAAIAAGDSKTSVSSNPFDFATASPALRRLVAKGTPALPAIEARIRNGSGNGLTEYLLMIAALQITKVDVANGPGDSPLANVVEAKQWPDAWSTYRKSVPGWAKDIMHSRMTNAEKNRALSALGTPALPAIVDEIAAGRSEYSPAADALIQGCVEVDGATDVHITADWARANGRRMEPLRQLTK